MSDLMFDLIAQLPKIELHLHLEGAIRYETLLEFYENTDTDNKDIDIHKLKKIERYENLTQFVHTMKSIGDLCIKSAKDYERVAYELFEDLSKQNIVYAEVSYDPTRGLRVGIPVEDIIAAVYQAKLKAEGDFNIKIGLILGIGREHGIPVFMDFARKIDEYKIKYGIVGIDLHGNENARSSSEFAEGYDIIRNCNLGLRAHAGESMESENIWDAIKYLNVSRVGHGVGAAYDESLLNYLQVHPVTLDICPSSNYMLSIVDNFEDHPIKKFFDMGIRVTISTDDPLYFNTTLNHEYHLLYKYFDFSIKDFYKLNVYAVEGSFADESTKLELMTILNNHYSA